MILPTQVAALQRSFLPFRPFGLLAFLVAWLAVDPASPEPANPCAPMRFEDAAYTVCTFDARRDDIRLFWKGLDNHVYGGFSRLAGALASHGRSLRFAMNAGMFEDDLSPVGLYIEEGRQRHRADLREGASNFHLRPNGVFYVGDGAAGVAETQRFLAEGPKARFATQSGPMLVLDGRIHPKISPSGASEKVRNGVGVRDGAVVFFAISEEPVTFYAFAKLFRDGLNCPNALFLDGTISSLYAPDLNRRDDPPRAIGPIIAVTAPAT
ncbi:MAG TPA: phosphodiester glycosidase family protein [Roseiarcus sp.]|nr:phosphodiester glycosidase family protein [Roseiarcus sp.]